jgi:hypothetical protein
MSSRRSAVTLARLSALSLFCAACGDDCIQPPCPSPTAILLTLTAASGASISGAVVTVNGASSATVPCFSQSSGTLCVVSGYAGAYNLSVAAPGFQSVLRTVVVSGESPSGCGCPSIDTQQISIALVPTP